MAVKNLDKLFAPHRVALLGSGDGGDGTDEVVLRNLLGGDFGGVIYPVVSGRESVFGVPTYANVLMLPHAADLAVIARPPDEVVGAARECGIAGVGALLVLSPGFRETDADGPRRLEQLRAVVRDFPSMRVLGPNSLGLVNTSTGLNASLSPAVPPAGRLTFLSQSRTLSSAILDRAVDRGVRLANFVSVGHMINVGFGDLIDYFAGDPQTRSLILYLHSISEPRAFMSAARAFARVKPIVAYKAGRHAAAAQAAASHTGHLVAEDMVYEAAFQRAGIVRATELDDIFDVAELLASQRLPRGPRLAIVSNSGAAAVVAVDYLMTHRGVLAELSQQTLQTLHEECACCRPASNPVDVGEAAPASCFSRAAEVVAGDPGVDAVVVLLTPQRQAQPTRTARRLAALAQSTTKPVLAAWIGGQHIRRGITILNQAGLPTHGTPEHAVRAFMHLVDYARNLEMIYETPRDVLIRQDVDRAVIRSELRALAAAGQTLLDPMQAERVIAAYGIPVCRSRKAATADAAARIAADVDADGVVLKALTHPPLAHKTDIGGVALGLASEQEVRQAFDRVVGAVRASGLGLEARGVTVQPVVHTDQGFEMILGAKKDPTFGPVVMIGMGGVTTDIIQDRAVGLPPLNERLARHMLESLRAWPLLQGYRGRRGVHVDALIENLIRFSHLIANHPLICEIDINPLLATDEGVIALDASVMLDPTAVAAMARPYQHLAIRPYPDEYVQHIKLKDGSAVCLRPIRPEDEPRWHELLGRCSDASIRNRFRSMFQRMSHDQASRYCYIDYDREITLVVEREDGEARRLVGVGGLVAATDRQSAEFSVLVVDDWQGRGLGGTLLDCCLAIAAAWGLDEVVAETDPTNHRMLAAFERRRFRRDPVHPDDEAVVVRRAIP